MHGTGQHRTATCMRARELSTKLLCKSRTNSEVVLSGCILFPAQLVATTLTVYSPHCIEQSQLTEVDVRTVTESWAGGEMVTVYR